MFEYHYDKFSSCECNNSVPGDDMIRCGATIWAPSQSHFVEDRAFSCFAMDCEGMFDETINVNVNVDGDFTAEEIMENLVKELEKIYG